MAIPHKCPICDGIGGVPTGFYNRHPHCGWASNSTALESCRSCDGFGFVWEPTHLYAYGHFQDTPIISDKDQDVDLKKSEAQEVNTENCLNCGHRKSDHIYEEGACRPGSLCDCQQYKKGDKT